MDITQLLQQIFGQQPTSVDVSGQTGVGVPGMSKAQGLGGLLQLLAGLGPMLGGSTSLLSPSAATPTATSANPSPTVSDGSTASQSVPGLSATPTSGEADAFMRALMGNQRWNALMNPQPTQRRNDWVGGGRTDRSGGDGTGRSRGGGGGGLY